MATPNAEDTRSLNYLMKNFVRAYNMDTPVTENREAKYAYVVQEFSNEATEVLLTGSYFDGLSIQDMSNVTNDGQNELDNMCIDLVLLDKAKKVCPDGTEGVHQYFAQMEGIDTHAGYVRLKKTQNCDMHESVFYSSGEFQNSFEQRKDTDKLSNLLIKNDASCQAIRIIPALPCSQWPKEASKWVSRTRNYEWPSQELVQSIVDKGCFLIPEPHELNVNRDTEWKLSFASAEKKLTLALEEEQRMAFLLLKTIYRNKLQQLGTPLCAEHLKACLLWTCEETDPTLWTEDNMGDCLRVLLMRLMKCLSQKCLPNFFVPDNNMIDHFSDEHILLLLTTLQEIYVKPWECLLPLQYLYTMNQDNIYDMVQSILSEVGLQDFYARTHYHSSPGLLTQIFKPVMDDAEQGMYNEENILVSTTKLACGLIFANTDNQIGNNANWLAASKVLLDLIDQLEELGYCPTHDGCQPEHDAAFIAQLVHHIVLLLPKNIVTACSFAAWSFLNYLVTSTNIADADRDSMFLVHLIQLACTSISHSEVKQDSPEYFIIHRSLEQIKNTLPVHYTFLAACFYDLTNENEKCVHELQNCKDKCDVTLVTQTADSKACNIHGMLKGILTAADDQTTEGKYNLSLPINSTTWDKWLVLQCVVQGGTLRISSLFLATYLLTVNHQHPSRDIQHLQITTKPSDLANLFLLGCQLIHMKQWDDGLKICKQILCQQPNHAVAMVFHLLCKAWISKEEDAQEVISHNLNSTHDKEQFSNEENDYRDTLKEPGAMNLSHMTEVFLKLDMEDLMVIHHYLQYQTKHLSASSCLLLSCGRSLHALSYQTNDDDARTRLLYMAEMALSESVVKSGKDIVYLTHYCNFLWKERKSIQLVEALDDVKKTVDQDKTSCNQVINVLSPETHTAPWFLKPYLSRDGSVQVPCSFVLLFYETLVNKIMNGPGHEELLYERIDIEQMEARQARQATESGDEAIIHNALVHDICGHALYKGGQYIKARHHFIKAVNKYGGEHRLALDSITQCEDRLFDGAVTLMFSEEYADALELYCNLWDTCLPRCQIDCSVLLHLSQLLLMIAKEDKGTIQTGITMLELAVSKLKKDTPVTHIPHALSSLACLYYKMSLKADDEEIQTENKEKCERLLREAIVCESGCMHLLMGNFLFIEGRFEESLEFLQKAITKGIVMLPHNEVNLKAPHDLVSLTQTLRTHNFFPVETFFELLASSLHGNFESYLVYAHYLRTLAQRQLSQETETSKEEFKLVCTSMKPCPLGAHTLLALVYLQDMQFDEAQQLLEEEVMLHISPNSGKHVLHQQLYMLARCCSMMKSLNFSDAAKYTVKEWLQILNSTDHNTQSVHYDYDTNKAVQDSSFAWFMATHLPKVLNIEERDHLHAISMVYELLKEELGETDPFANGLSAQIPILLCGRYELISDAKEKEELANDIQQAFDKAFNDPNTCPSTARIAYAGFLLPQFKFEGALTHSSIAFEIATQQIYELLQARIEDNDVGGQVDHMLTYYIQKALIPATDQMVICYAIQEDFSKAFDIVDVMLAILHRAQGLHVDPLAYLIKYTVELPRFGASIVTVISFHQAIIKRYPTSHLIATIYNNLGCMLFVHAKQSGDDLFLDKAMEHFNLALECGGMITIGLYADYANFLYNTGQYEAVIKLICESDDLDDTATGSNSYGTQEVGCVDAVIQKLIGSNPNGKFLIDSHFYIQYLRVSALLALDKDVEFVQSEIDVLHELGETKGIEHTDYLCSALKKRVK